MGDAEAESDGQDTGGQGPGQQGVVHQGRVEAFAEALARLHAALADVANGEVAAIKALYAHDDDATSFYGWGGYEKGWDAVSRRWDWAAEQFGGGSVSHENVSTVIGGELAFTTDIETFVVTRPGAPAATRWSNRVTHVFRLQQGRWRLLHRHANRLETRYEPGERETAG